MDSTVQGLISPLDGNTWERRNCSYESADVVECSDTQDGLKLVYPQQRSYLSF